MGAHNHFGSDRYETVNNIRIQHYGPRYQEHMKSVIFSEARLIEIKQQIKLTLLSNEELQNKDFEFLVDIAGLVIAARRSLAYTYPIRYYQLSETKQRFFDFIQGDLERSLEKLNEQNEKDWTKYLETDVRGRTIVSMKFIQYKE